MTKGTILRHIVAPLLILAVAGGVVWLLKLNKPEVNKEKPEEKKWIIQTAVIEQGDFRPEEELVGLVRSVRNRSLHSEISSEIIEIHRHSGESVKQGDVILTLKNRDAKIDYQTTQADLINARSEIEIAKNNHQLNIQTLAIEKKQLIIADRELKRQTEMFRRKLISRSELDRAQMDMDARELRVAQKEVEILNFAPRLKQLEAQFRKIELALEKSKERLDSATLKAPFEGRLTRVIGQVGQIVNPGQELAYLYAPNQMEVFVQLPAVLVTALMSGEMTMEQITGSLKIGNRQLVIRLKSMSGSVEKGYASQQGVFVIEEEGNAVTPGQSVALKMEIAPEKNSFLIPELALFEDKWVYRQNKDKRLEAIEVQVLGTKQLDQPHYIVRTDRLNAKDRLMITRLSNAITGLLTTSAEEAAKEKARKLEVKKKKEDEDQSEHNSDESSKSTNSEKPATQESENG